MKAVTHKIARALAFVAIGPLLLWARLRISEQSRFSAPAQALALVPGVTGILLRRVFYERTLKHCGRNFTVDWLAVVRTSQSEVGDNCTLGVASWVGWAVLGEDVIVGPHVVIASGGDQHGFDDLSMPMRLQSGAKRQVAVGDDVWIGAGARILSDVSAGTVVGAGAVVTSVHPPRAVIAGVPARVIKMRGGSGRAS